MERCKSYADRTGETMELQRIIFPTLERCTVKELYFRESRHTGEITETSRTLLLKKGQRISFDTYFNAFSIEKWSKYTTVGTVFLRLKLSGKIKLYLLHKQLKDGHVQSTVLSEKTVDASNPELFESDYTDSSRKGLYTFEIEALSENCRLYEGAYGCRASREAKSVIKIGLCICTYKRENFVEKNLHILNKEITDNPDSPLYGNLEILIADNGRTLDGNRLQTANVHIYPNRNLGGAGGFTRCLIEILEHNDCFGITHILFMDDDVLIEPEAIVRTYLFLSLLKEPYKDASVGGAMLRMDKPYIQTESGALWNGGAWKPLKSGLDMRNLENCLYNEQEEPADYAGWWYCCFPVSLVSGQNLPLPLFIRCDDIEYGLRNLSDLILMGGICVWHEPSEHKYTSYLEYYTARNQLITNALHCQQYGIRQIERTILSRCVQEIMLYRYKNVALYLQGILDFLKGPLWLAAQDAEALHIQILAQGYQSAPVDIPQPSFGVNSAPKKADIHPGRRRRFLTFNGLFLPAKGNACIPAAQAKTAQAYRKKELLHYSENSRTGFITRRSVGMSIKYICKMLRVMSLTALRYKKIRKKYSQEGQVLKTSDFWKPYLGLKEQNDV